MQAWLFYIALVLFPLWWVGAFWRVPKTRVVGGTDTEKAVPLDDPQIEFGALESFFFQFKKTKKLNVTRCAVLAVPLSNYGGHVVGHLRPVYHPCLNLCQSVRRS